MLGFIPKKRFGQHFMTDAQDLHFIAEALDVEKGAMVLEIGPGLGALTRSLLDKGLQVVAVEKDRDLAKRLVETQDFASLRVIQKDILCVDLATDLGLKTPISVVGNIPYNITSPILFWLIEQRALIRHAVLTTQREVAQRLAGKPGHRDWGALSVSVQAYAEVRLLKKVPPSHFHPAPKVDSAVVRLEFLEKPRFEAAHRELFHTLVARAFQKRRKTLLNALEDESAGRTKTRLSAAFSQAGFDPKRRPETLAVSEWVLLARCLSG